MKRSEIIKLLEDAGKLMDAVDGAILRNKETGEDAVTVTSDEIRAFQTAFAFCRHILEGDYEPTNALGLATDMLMLLGGLKEKFEDTDD